MFREMRRIRQKLTDEETRDILRRGTSGVLALSGDEGYPYALPISYLYDGGKLYFHCAKAGHKIDAIARSDKASFCVIDQDQTAPEIFTTLYRSAIAFGRIRIMEDDPDKRRAIERLADKYAPGGDTAHRDSSIEREWSRLNMLELTIEHLSGKEGIELVKARGANKD
ncbi:MAG: pyridoxamine 5'-phosphate oxidase family protein [Oscillospiraceae bacterium]|nr:pyridoxamine 5'-phosphate oxidase family protein [Oscillospiraceae bacterium]